MIHSARRPSIQSKIFDRRSYVVETRRIIIKSSHGTNIRGLQAPGWDPNISVLPFYLFLISRVDWHVRARSML
jgi:hypothetical protein